MRYLIHTGPGIGDIVQFLSMARAIKEQYADSTVDLLMRGSDATWKLNRQILECQDYVDNLYWYSVKELKHDFKLIFQLRRNHYDFGIVRIGNVVGNPSLWIYRIMRFAGCKKIVGTGTDKVDVKINLQEEVHYLKRNAMLLQPTGVTGRDNAISINKDKLDDQWLSSLDIPDSATLIGISMGTNPMKWREGNQTIVYDVKSWPYERWLALAEALVRKGYWVALIGGSKECKEIEHKGLLVPKGDKIINLVGKTSIRQSLTIINRCNLMVGAEGGMMHCASALGTETLTIFGGSDYRMWNPGGENSAIVNLYLPCAPCFCTSRGAHCKEHKCLMDISVQKVLDVLQLLLQKRGIDS